MLARTDNMTKALYQFWMEKQENMFVKTNGLLKVPYCICDRHLRTCSYSPVQSLKKRCILLYCTVNCYKATEFGRCWEFPVRCWRCVHTRQSMTDVLYCSAISGKTGNPMHASFSTPQSHRRLRRWYCMSHVVNVLNVLIRCEIEVKEWVP